MTGLAASENLTRPAYQCAGRRPDRWVACITGRGRTPGACIGPPGALLRGLRSTAEQSSRRLGGRLVAAVLDPLGLPVPAVVLGAAGPFALAFDRVAFHLP